MACNFNKIQPYFTIELFTRNSNDLYAFIGKNIEQELNKILKKLEKNIELTKKEKNMITKKFGEYSNNWLNRSYTTKLKFINEIIYVDDTINNIKNKIFIYIGKENLDYYENNQELWIEKGIDDYEILGYSYLDSKIKPSVFEKYKIDTDFFYSEDGARIYYYELLNNNSNIIYDYIFKGTEIITKIGLSILKNEIEYLKKKDIEINDKIKYGYLIKYYPKFILNQKINKTELIDIKRKINIDNYNHYIINNTFDINTSNKIIYNNCNIYYIKLEALNESYFNDCNVNLYKIFNYLRKDLSIEMPYIKYKDNIWLTTYTAIYDRAIKENIIEKKTIQEWLFNIKKDRETKEILITSTARGIQIKLLIPKTKYKYFTLNIYKNSKIEVKINYDDIEDINTFDRVIETLNVADNLIKKINLIDINIKKDDTKKLIKLQCPKLIYKNDYYYTNIYTKIISICYFFNFDTGFRFEFKEFYDILIRFKTFIAPILSDKVDYDSLKAKYKRVSKFKNMPIIFNEITKLKNDGVSDIDVIPQIMKKYDKTNTEVKYLLIDWKKRTGLLKSKGLMRQSGIDISMKQDFETKTGNIVSISECKNIYQMISIYHTLRGIINIYINFKNYTKDSNFKKYIIETDKNLYNDENNDENNINELTLENLENLNINNDNYNINIGLDLNLNEINSEDSKISKLLLSNDIYTKTYKNKDIEKDIFKKKSDLYLAPNSEIGKDIGLSSQDCEPNYAIDSCKDLCDDSNYSLRRLQRYDNKLFHFKDKTKKFKTYGRLCQKNDESQPIVMANDPDKDPSIDKSSYTYSIKTGSSTSRQFYYICPRIWDPYVEKPVSYDAIKDSIIKKKTKNGICLSAKSPYGDHDVIIRSDEKFKPYPGFLSPSKHPDGLCMPACYIKPHNDPKTSKYKQFKKCLGENVEDNTSDKKDEYYVLDKTKIPLDEGRYGLLPTNISKIFKSDCISGLLQNNTMCYLRYGIKQNNQSFLNAICDIISENRMNKITIKQLIDYIIEKLTKKLFNTLNNGSLGIIFYNRNSNKSSYDNFINYLKSNDEINFRYLWDLFSRPNILFEEGLNIVIMNEEFILCPVGENVTDFYNYSKKTVFILKHINFFEPIYYLNNNNDGLFIKILFDPTEKIVLDIIGFIQKYCLCKNEIDWNKILKNNEIFLNNIPTKIVDEITFNYLNNILKLDNKFIQVKDYYNKFCAVLLPDFSYIPILPQKLLLNIPNTTEPILVNYNLQKKRLLDLNNKYNISTNIVGKIVDNNNYIIAIVLETNRIVPVKDTKNVNDNIPILDINYYKSADKIIYYSDKIDNNRLTSVNKYKFENESYQRLRLEFSRYIQLKPKYFNLIYELIYSNQDYNNKYEYMYKLIKNIMKYITGIIKNINDIDNYKIYNEKIPCLTYSSNQKLCSKNFHCIYKNNKCLLKLIDKNLINGKNNVDLYSRKIADELLSNLMKRDDILYNNIPDIIDKTKIIPYENEIIFFDKDNFEIINDIDKLYKPKMKIFISEKNIFDYVDPIYYGIDLSKYLFKDIKTKDISLEPLSVYWDSILGNKFKVYITSDLFTSVYKSLKDLYDIKPFNIREKIADYLENITNNDILNISQIFNIQPNKNILELYLYISKSQFKKIYKDNFIKYIKSSEYTGNIIDIYLIHILYNINIIILEKRISKNNLKGYNTFYSNKNKNIIILYSQKYLDFIKYYIVTYNNNFIFNKESLPPLFITTIDIFRKKII